MLESRSLRDMNLTLPSRCALQPDLVCVLIAATGSYLGRDAGVKVTPGYEPISVQMHEVFSAFLTRVPFNSYCKFSTVVIISGSGHQDTSSSRSSTGTLSLSLSLQTAGLTLP
uniref:(California timema) hypothetical protein n=1 Tax=Timema californicum TaxID=61474 RepID=A0A7R9PDK6_TIMCA|nr:unnamed protein product [Timema californicum]